MDKKLIWKPSLEVDEVRGVSLILIQPRAAQREGGLLVHTLESPNQPQPPSWENAGADWGRICPINRGRTDRWLAPREPLGLAEGWDGIARVWYNLPASVTQTPPCLAPTTQSPPTPHKPNPHSAHWPKLSKPAREALHYQKCSFFAVAANDLWLPGTFGNGWPSLLCSV